METKIDAKVLAMELSQRLEDVLSALGVASSRDGAERLKIICPWYEFSHASMRVRGVRRGQWTLWASGDKGDFFDFVGFVLGGGVLDRARAYKWALQYLGYDRPFSQAERAKFEQEMRAKAAEQKRLQAQAEARAASELAAKRKRAEAIFLSAKPVVRGDPVHLYLLARGIDFDRLKKFPRSIRFAPDHQFLDEQTGEITKWPCMITAMMLNNGKIGAVHRTYLDRIEPKKAPLFDEKGRSVAKKMFPSSLGTTIRLWKGASNLVRNHAPIKSETILICEGIEDGLTHAMLQPKLRIEVIGSLSNMLSYNPPPCANEVRIAADRDWQGGLAAKLLDRVASRLAGMVKTTKIYPPDGFKDFNDALRGVKA